MKISSLSHFRYILSFCLVFSLVWFLPLKSTASTLNGCNIYVCEDLRTQRALPYSFDIQRVTGKFCDNLSFSPDDFVQSIVYTEPGLYEYTIYDLDTGNSCSATIEVLCGPDCKFSHTAYLELNSETALLQATDLVDSTCFGDEVILPPYDDGLFAVGEYDVLIYSPTTGDTCTSMLTVMDACAEFSCYPWTRDYYNTLIWPQRVLDYPCPDTFAYFMEILDASDVVLQSGTSLFLDESLPDDGLNIRITHLESGEQCISDLELHVNCVMNAVDTIFLDFTGLDTILVPWNSFFTEDCPHMAEGGYGIGYAAQNGAVRINDGGSVTFKNRFRSFGLVISDGRNNPDYNQRSRIVMVNESLEYIEGYVFQDTEGACVSEDIPEFGAENILVYAMSATDTFYTYTVEDGYYCMEVPEFYDYELGIITSNNFWDICVSEPSFYVDDATKKVDVGLTIDTSCTYLTTYLTIPRFRRCFQNLIYINYCNLGTDTAYDATLDFYFEEGLEIDAEEYGFEVIDDYHYQLQLGDLAPLECDMMVIHAFVDCDLDFDTELCVEVEIGPIPDCNISEEWSGAALDVQGECDGDTVRFTITNIGDTDMSQPQEFIVIEDDIMIIQDMTNLPSGESIEVTLPANGSTYRLISDQEPFHPFTEQVSAMVKACADGSSAISTGFANSFILDEQAPYISIECGPVIGSYDPNDKAVIPEGVYENNIIEGDEVLEFTIRFENTGTDTAFNIFIRDTLDANLDLHTFNVVASSHPVLVDYPTDGQLFFRFIDIQLPDTSVNKLDAQGFVKYTIKAKEDLPLESKIYNTAHILFDFNTAIVTNTVDLQVGELISTSTSDIPEMKRGFVSPNPAEDLLNVHAEYDYYVIADINGVDLKKGDFSSTIGIETLDSGVYLLRIYEDGILIGIEKFVKINFR